MVKGGAEAPIRGCGPPEECEHASEGKAGDGVTHVNDRARNQAGRQVDSLRSWDRRAHVHVNRMWEYAAVEVQRRTGETHHKG